MTESQSNSRRNFIIQSTLAALAMSPIATLLSGCGKDGEFSYEGGLSDTGFHDDFHYFANNLCTLHFYFLNAGVKGKKVFLKEGLNGYMVVKIPQQHIAEQLFREGVVNETVVAESSISGFSYLAFKLMPRRDIKDKRSFNVKDIETLLQWDDLSLYELVIPVADEYYKFDSDFCTFRNNTVVKISEASTAIISFYKNTCTALFNKPAADFPVTMLEIPRGLLTTGYAGKETGKRYTKPVFSVSDLKKTRFVYMARSRTITRSVQEIWNVKMWFQQFEKDSQGKEFAVGEKFDVSLRPFAYILSQGDHDVECPATKDECDAQDHGYLPSFLDRQELTYIASLGRKQGLNEGKEWNIETKGLSFTGLGCIAKLHYKNLTPPLDTDLAEYEHHITLGRDEYIKVARIGVISATGQRALYVKIGQRKISNGISYMELKEYIEIVQPKINYFEPSLFIKGEPDKNQPRNYIQARKLKPSKSNNTYIIHSFDDVYNGIPDTDANDDVWRDRDIWKLNVLPENWYTHYRRWMFTRLESVNLVSQPIDTTLPEALLYTEAACGCGKAFWPVLEKAEDSKHKDCKLEFIGYDWNNNPVRFSSTFLFISKKIVECNSIDFSDKIFNKLFFSQPAERRFIRLENKEIAFAPDYQPQDLPNRSNIAKTDYVEYYFSLCREKSSKDRPELAGFDASNAIIKIPIKDEELPDAIFNERIFPLFPQMRSAQLYAANIQGYSAYPLPGIAEYHNDLVEYGYTEAIRDKGIPRVDAATKLPVIYNKAKLLFNHTDLFRQNKEKIHDFVNEKWIERNIDGYTNIKEAFGGAGEKIGAIVNPDFDIQSIALIKQSIAVGKDINKKYEQVKEAADAIKNFNPVDLLRQAPEIFRGISLLDILKAVFPEYEAPVNEIKEKTAQITNVLENSDLVKEIKEDLKAARTQLKTLQEDAEKIKSGITGIEKDLQEKKDALVNRFQFPDIRNLVNNKIEEYKNIYVTNRNEITGRIDIAVNEAIDMIASQAAASFEKIIQATVDMSGIYNFLVALRDEIGAADPVTRQLVIDCINLAFLATGENIDTADVIGFIKDASGKYIPYAAIVKKAESRVNDAIAPYKKWQDAAEREQAEKAKMLQGLASDYQNARNELESAKKAYDLLLNDKKERSKALTVLVNKLPEKYREKVMPVTGKFIQVYELILSFDLPYLIEKFEILKKDYRVLEAKIGTLKDSSGNNVLDIINITGDRVNGLKDLAKNVQQSYKTFSSACRTEYDKKLGISSEFNRQTQELSLFINQKLNDVSGAIEIFLTGKFYPSIQEIKGSIKDIQEVEAKLVAKKNDLRTKLQDYENKLKQQVSDEAASIIQKLTLRIEAINAKLRDDPANRQLVRQLIAANDLYNTLTSLSEKDIAYVWKTSSIKSADFGIVSFIAFDNPRTTLSVEVHNIIKFQPGKFPPVINSIESSVENRLSSFGISLMKAMTISFDEVSFTAGTNRDSKFDVKIRDVEFTGAFSFVQALQSWLKSLMGDAFRLKLLPTSVNIGYTLPIPDIKTPGFNFFNLTLNFDFWLHFNKKPMQLGFSLARQDNKFGVSVGIYAGFGFFSLIAEPRNGITEIEVGLEFGGYYGLTIGPLRGEVKLVVGLYYKKTRSEVIIEGYFLCEGRVQLWFIMINARFYMGVRSQGNYVEGRCTVSYEIRLGCFFKLSFQASYYKKIAGASPGNNGGGSSMARSLNAFDSVNVNDNAEQEEIINPVKRNVKRLTRRDWEEFINSYNS